MSASESVRVDCAVIGAGVVGIAIARAIQMSGLEVVLIEKGATFGIETSSRNSEVIHAGIYYEPNSLKARLCTRGKALLYDYCATKGVEFRRIGKIIVATKSEDEAVLHGYRDKAERNGLNDLIWVSRHELASMEPQVSARLGLLSPSTGIIDSHGLMQSLLGDFQQAGGIFSTQTPFVSGLSTGSGLSLQLGDRTHSILSARHVINSAGLSATQVAAAIEGVSASLIPGHFLAIGHYYGLSGRSPFKRLIYPVAEKGGLGIHATLDLGGRVRFGPDVRWRDSVDYSFDDSRKSEFIKAIRSYFPGIFNRELTPGYTGIRPKLFGPAKPEQDFVIQTEEQHRVKGLINLFGIESPGLTAALAIGEVVSEIVSKDSPLVQST